MPVTYYDYGNIPALDIMDYHITIPDDGFIWNLADFSCYMIYTGWVVARIAINDVDVWRDEAIFMVSWPQQFFRLNGIQTATGKIVPRFKRPNVYRPFVCAPNDDIHITIANIYEDERYVSWVMSFFRRQA